MNIQGLFSSAGTAIANTASKACGLGKYLIDKGYSACSPLVNKVSEVAGRFIPTAVSNAVKTYPKSFALVAGIGLGSAIYKIFHRCNGQTPPPPRSL